MKRAWDDPEEGARRRAALAELNRSEERQRRSSERMLARLADPAFRAKLSRTMKETMKRRQLKERAAAHARLLALKINARRLSRRLVVPPGKMQLYKKLRAAGIPRRGALRQCWLSHGGTS